MGVVGAETGIRAFGTKFDIVSEGTKVLRGEKIKMLNERCTVGYGAGHPNWEVEVVGAKMGILAYEVDISVCIRSEANEVVPRRRERFAHGDACNNV